MSRHFVGRYGFLWFSDVNSKVSCPFLYSPDLNECDRNIDHCHRLATCNNERGSYTCTRVTMDTWETALTVIIVMQVTFLVLLYSTFKLKYVIK